MTKTVSLNANDHRHIWINTQHNLGMAASVGEQENACLTFVGELRSVQAHYPVFLQKDPQTACFYPVALLGFARGENLYLSETAWECPYVPALLARQPFSIGVKTDESGEEKRVVHIDLSHPRVCTSAPSTSSQAGFEALFEASGTHSPYLQKMANLLESIHIGLQQNASFTEALEKFDLIESFTLEVELLDGSQNQLLGYYTVNEEKLYALSAEQLHDLNSAGFLSAAYMLVASQSQLSNLIARKNQQLRAGQ